LTSALPHPFRPVGPLATARPGSNAVGRTHTSQSLFSAQCLTFGSGSVSLSSRRLDKAKPAHTSRHRLRRRKLMTSYPALRDANSTSENHLRHIDFAVACIRRALTNVERDRHTRAVLSPEVAGYLLDLAVRHPDDGSEFSRFVISLPYDAIHHE